MLTTNGRFGFGVEQLDVKNYMYTRRCIKLDSSVAGVGWQKNHPGAKNGAETLIFLHFW